MLWCKMDNKDLVVCVWAYAVGAKITRSWRAMNSRLARAAISEILPYRCMLDCRLTVYYSRGMRFDKCLGHHRSAIPALPKDLSAYKFPVKRFITTCAAVLPNNRRALSLHLHWKLHIRHYFEVVSKVNSWNKRAHKYWCQRFDFARRRPSAGPLQMRKLHRGCRC